MDDATSITELVRRYRHGDPQAAQRLFACYAQRLNRLAEQCLDRRLAGRVEGEDVVQSALRTFFRRSLRGEFQIDSAAQLWQLSGKRGRGSFWEMTPVPLSTRRPLPAA
jgi:hypothetical protein